jgi:transposase
MQKYFIFVGIDMSKKWFDACITHQVSRIRLHHGRFDNTPKGFGAFRRWMGSYAHKQKIDLKILICLEHTGIYTLPLCNYLQQVKIDYVLEHPLQIKQSVGMRRGKSDTADAKVITQYLLDHYRKLTPSTLSCDKLLRIRKLLSYRSRLVKYRVGLSVAANELKVFSHSSIHQFVCQSTDEVYQQMEQQRKAVEKEILRTIAEDDELQRLYDLTFSVTGVGLVIAATLLVYTNAFQAFQNARQFTCYVGIVPFGKSSGTSRDEKPKLSHLAHKPLKALLTNGAWAAIRGDAQIKAFYQRQIKEGKQIFDALNAVKNKLVQRIFAVVKRGTPYVELGTHKA